MEAPCSYGSCRALDCRAVLASLGFLEALSLGAFKGDPALPVVTEKYYDSPFCAQDHQRLREVLGHIKGRFILSYNDHPLVRELYADYRIEEVTRTSTLAGSGNNQTQYAELIIRNF